MISLDLTKSSEVRKAGDRSNCIRQGRTQVGNGCYSKEFLHAEKKLCPIRYRSAKNQEACELPNKGTRSPLKYMCIQTDRLRIFKNEILRRICTYLALEFGCLQFVLKTIKIYCPNLFRRHLDTQLHTYVCSSNCLTQDLFEIGPTQSQLRINSSM